jgi:hypothetical protein
MNANALIGSHFGFGKHIFSTKQMCDIMQLKGKLAITNLH